MSLQTSSPPKNKGGRPPKPVDEKLVKELASIMCTMEEIGHIVKVSVDTLERRFADVIKEGRSVGKTSLRRLQWKIAMGGNPSMCMFLGKVLLGQREEEIRDTPKFNVVVRSIQP